ncbi:hypothetical protein QMT40_001838 [Parvibaculaceae bacterium PLY_AMNH_Bact1]|nr:hypothetical protein QMT40_001838 [Parvibaculaceae bacterium PLY_AMNH_Bact1]
MSNIKDLSLEELVARALPEITHQLEELNVKLDNIAPASVPLSSPAARIAAEQLLVKIRMDPTQPKPRESTLTPLESFLWDLFVALAENEEVKA